MLFSRKPLEALLCLAQVASLFPSASARNTTYINGTGIDGVTRKLDVSRMPALYSGDFADCMTDGSLFNVTLFDTAYYKDNLTVLFHLDGTTNLREESVMLNLDIEIYGQSRFNKTYNPCDIGIGSLCPASTGTEIQAWAASDISADDVAGIPSIAINIPDLEGFARLRIFSNSTKSEIGCFQAAMRNGQTFSQPSIVGSLAGAFTAVAILASFATAIYGLQIPHIRMHYAHSFSILIIFETFQSIFFSGVLSVEWPSMLPAWWSNFAWSAGMFGSNHMIHNMASFAGISGNASQVGGAGSVPLNNDGGLSQQIYGRALDLGAALGLSVATPLVRRGADFNASNPYDYSWKGSPLDPGLPTPGQSVGFAGTLSTLHIPLKDAFTLALVWFLVMVGSTMLFVAFVKGMLELLAKTKLITTDGFDYFRSHWLDYMTAGVLRVFFIGFFAMTTFALVQFTTGGPAGPTAIAAIVFVIFVAFMGLACYACYARIREGRFEVVSDRIRFEQGKILGGLPFIAVTRESVIGEEEEAHNPRLFGTMPFFRIKFTDTDPERPAVHEDLGYIKRYGWLSARYRRTRWWFFVVYLGYQLVRACFLGGGARNPLAQVYGLFAFDVFALVAIMKLKPFEGARNTTLAVWLVSISKIVTTGFSIAFLPSFALDRTVTTIFGIIILVVQAFLAAAVLILVILGLISSSMSLVRNREDFPAIVDEVRVRYYEHMSSRANLALSNFKNGKEPAQPSAPLFTVREVRRESKVGGNEAFPTLAESGLEEAAGGSGSNMPSNRPSRANSASSRFSVSSLPKTGRTHRPSWNASDFAEWDAEMNRGDQARISHIRNNSLRKQSLKYSGSRPMTPTRESSKEFIRTIPNMINPSEQEDGTKTVAGSRIDEEVEEKPRRRRTVSFVDGPPKNEPASDSDATAHVDATLEEKMEEETTEKEEEPEKVEAETNDVKEVDMSQAEQTEKARDKTEEEEKPRAKDEASDNSKDDEQTL